jgi:hypothetical protein
MQKFSKRHSFYFLFLILLFMGCNNTQKDLPEGQKKSPITVNTTRKMGFATFDNRNQPGNTIGYRFFEHAPLIFNKDSIDVVNDPNIDSTRINRLVKSFSASPGVAVYKRNIGTDENWIQQSWTFYLAPADDGIDLLLTVQTYKTALPYYYGVQQCFRMSGATNAAWRQEIARTPAFSEFDLWAGEDDKREKTSLTYGQRNGQWQVFPADSLTVGARTPLGMCIDREKFAGRLPEIIGPYRAKMGDPLDNGLITRINKEQTWVCGIYWENTSHVTDHHPADCLHSIVNIGNIPANAKRAIRGKIYWFQGSLKDLAEKFKNDFAHE